jgi:hypothetical protein
LILRDEAHYEGEDTERVRAPMPLGRMGRRLAEIAASNVQHRSLDLYARLIKAGRREYVQVLRLLETFELDDLHAAVKSALRLGAVGFDAVKHLVLCQVEKRPPKLDLNVYPYLPRANVARTSAASYMCLVSGDAA